MGKTIRLRSILEIGANQNVAVYHEMRPGDDFDQTARMLFECLQMAQQKWPDRPRFLYLDIQGHRNAAGGFDQDALEIIGPFVLEFLGPFFTEISQPLVHLANNHPQRNDIPPSLEIKP